MGRVRDGVGPDGFNEQQIALVARLRDQVLDVVVNLSRRGKIEARYGLVPIAYEGRST
jgi:hypothetical protein